MAKIRIGIIGAGGRGIFSFGHMFSNEFNGEVQVAALGEPNRARAQAALTHLREPAEIHTTPEDVCERKDLDAVVVTTPDYLHEHYAVLALKRGKHVLVDKPLATTGRGCLRVIAAARRSKKLLYMGFNMRHDPVVHQLKQLVSAGTLGAIFSMQAIEYYNGGRTYMARWNRLKKFSGGLFIHKGSHDFDVINWIMGQARPVRVSCFASVFTLNPKGLPFKTRRGIRPGPRCPLCPYFKECPDRSPFTQAPPGQKALFDETTAKFDGYYRDTCIYLSEKDTHDQGIAIVEYDNGATASHSEYFVTAKTSRQYLVEGTLGHADANLETRRIEILPRWSTNRIVHEISSIPGGHGGADPQMCAEFIRCIRKGLRPTASGIDGAWSVAIGEACERSRAEHRLVAIAEVLDVKSPLLRG
jgi:predicted dehydrogenase